MSKTFPSISYTENEYSKLMLSVRDDLHEYDATKAQVPHLLIKMSGPEVAIPLSTFRKMFEDLTKRASENV